MTNAVVCLRAKRKGFKRFTSDRRGAIAILFALAVLPLIFLIGLAVDFRSLQISRANMQNALDAALLAAARTYTDNPTGPSITETNRKALAAAAGTAMWQANLADSGPKLYRLQIDFAFNPETLRVQATGKADAPTAFGGLLGLSDLPIKVEGSARGADQRRVEVVLALDNTGSMYNNNRMVLMRKAAMSFVEKLYTQQTTTNKLYVGVVPWTTTVNINMETPIEAWSSSGSVTPSESFEGSREMPATPQARFRNYASFPQSHFILSDNATWKAYTNSTPVNYNDANAEHVKAWDALFAPVAWRGCIRAAVSERIVDSKGKITALTDSPPAAMRWQANAIEPMLKSWSSGNGIMCGWAKNKTQADSSYNSYIDKKDRDCVTDDSSSASVKVKTVDYTAANAADAQKKFRMPCVSDAFEFKYLAPVGQGGEGKKFCAFKDFTLPRASYDDPWMAGPNVNCPSPMLGLSGDKVQVLNTLNRMYANSDGTHQDIGLMWGLRVLSPNPQWKTFFGTGTNNSPYAYDTDKVRKVMILLTDGENVVPTRWEGYYGCSVTSTTTRGKAGACWNSSDINGGITQAKLDALTKDACSVIRSAPYNIELYTIAVDVTNNTAINLLKDCAGDTSRAFNISASEINATFLEIADKALRITD